MFPTHRHAQSPSKSEFVPLLQQSSSHKIYGVFSELDVLKMKSLSRYTNLQLYVTLFLCIAGVPAPTKAEANPPVTIVVTSYRDTPERWTADSADASQCRSFSAPNGSVSFSPNGYAEIDGGHLKCQGGTDNHENRRERHDS